MAANEKSVERSADELDEKQKEIRGSRNLTILGIVSTGIAILTTAVSLIVYHNSGDIYLDRSRPGYLPDKSEIQTQVEENSYEFSVTGPLSKEAIDEYVKHFEEELNAIDDLKAPFSEEPLSDKSLGVPEPKQEEQEEVPAEEQPYYWWY